MNKKKEIELYKAKKKDNVAKYDIENSPQYPMMQEMRDRVRQVVGEEIVAEVENAVPEDKNAKEKDVQVQK